MPLFETDSIILKSYNLAEADRIVVFYTREHGLVRGVAKGARRIKSKFGSTLEPFSEVKLEYFQKDDRELVSIQRAESIRSSFKSASDPEILAAYSKVVELLLAFVPPHDRNEKIYRMVRACLDTAISDRADREAMKLYFSIWILKLAGYLPDWRGCASCHRDFAEGESSFLDQSNRLICGSCNRTSNNEIISPAHRSLILQAQRIPPKDFTAVCAEHHGIAVDVSRLLKRFISSAIGREVDMNSGIWI